MTTDYIERFESFYDAQLAERIDDLASNYDPDARSLRFGLDELQMHDSDLAGDILNSPENLLTKANIALREYSGRIDRAVRQADRHATVNVRVHGVPESSTYRVGKYRTRDLGSLIAVRGQVGDTEPVVPNVERATWKCHRCGEFTETHQQYGDMIQPAVCPACESQGPWKLVESESDLVDFQEVTLFPIDSARDDPPHIEAYLKDDLTDTVGKHDRAMFVGRYQLHPQQNETQLRTYLEVVDIKGAEEREAGLDTESLRETIREEVLANQNEGTEFGVPRETLVETVTTSTMREQEVAEVLDGLVDEDIIKDANGKLVCLEK